MSQQSSFHGGEQPTPGELKVPAHIAIVMDGNGRWAQARGLPRLAGHRAGTENLRRVIEGCVEQGVRILTIYAFSTENWSRPAAEVSGLLRILEEMLEREVADLHKNGVQLRHIGRLEGITPELQQKVRQAVELTKNNQRLVLNVAFNYGGRAEIVDAVRSVCRSGADVEKLTEEEFASYLYTGDLADPDLVVRTADEERLSNFLIWQAAYAEYYHTPTFWPDFDKEELRKAIQAYSQRQRRFGGLISQ